MSGQRNSYDDEDDRLYQDDRYNSRSSSRSHRPPPPPPLSSRLEYYDDSPATPNTHPMYVDERYYEDNDPVELSYDPTLGIERQHSSQNPKWEQAWQSFRERWMVRKQSGRYYGDEDDSFNKPDPIYPSSVTSTSSWWSTLRRRFSVATLIIMGLFVLLMIIMIASLSAKAVQRKNSLSAQQAQLQCQEGRIQTIQHPQLELVLAGLSTTIEGQEETFDLARSINRAYSQATGGPCADALERWMVDVSLNDQVLVHFDTPQVYNATHNYTSALVTTFDTQISCRSCTEGRAFASVYPSLYGNILDDDYDDSLRRIVRRSLSDLSDLFPQHELESKQRQSSRRGTVVSRGSYDYRPSPRLLQQQEPGDSLNAGDIVSAIETEIWNMNLPNYVGVSGASVLPSATSVAMEMHYSGGKGKGKSSKSSKSSKSKGSGDFDPCAPPSKGKGKGKGKSSKGKGKGYSHSISCAPSMMPSPQPSGVPSATPSAMPSEIPSATPSAMPSATPTAMPSEIPSATPSTMPSATPSAVPSATPSAMPSSVPSSMPSATPSISPMPSSAPSDDTDPLLSLTTSITCGGFDQPCCSPNELGYDDLDNDGCLDGIVRDYGAFIPEGDPPLTPIGVTPLVCHSNTCVSCGTFNSPTCPTVTDILNEIVGGIDGNVDGCLDTNVVTEKGDSFTLEADSGICVRTNCGQPGDECCSVVGFTVCNDGQACGVYNSCPAH